MVLTEGWDMPEVSCCILARPTKKMGLYRQMVGRVLRPFLRSPMRSCSTIAAPCSGTDSSRTASSGRSIQTSALKARHITLGCILAIRAGSWSARMRRHARRRRACRSCGFLPQRPPQAIVFRDGDLAAVDRSQRIAQAISDPAERARWHAELAHIANMRGYQPGWVAHKFREKFGSWPASRYITPKEPSRKCCPGCAPRRLRTPRWLRRRHEAPPEAQALQNRRAICVVS